jgi:hypothetical protein
MKRLAPFIQSEGKFEDLAKSVVLENCKVRKRLDEMLSWTAVESK